MIVTNAANSVSIGAGSLGGSRFLLAFFLGEARPISVTISLAGKILQERYSSSIDRYYCVSAYGKLDDIEQRQICWGKSNSFLIILNVEEKGPDTTYAVRHRWQQPLKRGTKPKAESLKARYQNVYSCRQYNFWDKQYFSSQWIDSTTWLWRDPFRLDHYSGLTSLFLLCNHCQKVKSTSLERVTCEFHFTIRFFCAARPKKTVVCIWL